MGGMANSEKNVVKGSSSPLPQTISRLIGWWAEDGPALCGISARLVVHLYAHGDKDLT